MRVIKHTQNKLALELHQLDRLTNLSAFLDLADHPTVKPTQLIADIILDCTSIGDIVLDPFLSSGTTLLAAEQTKRRGIGHLSSKWPNKTARDRPSFEQVAEQNDARSVIV